MILIKILFYFTYLFFVIVCLRFLSLRQPRNRKMYYKVLICSFLALASLNPLVILFWNTILIGSLLGLKQQIKKVSIPSNTVINNHF